MKEHYRLAIYLAAYDPYKDIFDIFIDQFRKNWPDCPYPLIISNMFFEYEGDEKTIVIHCGDVKEGRLRKKRALEAVDADYFLGMEEDRIITDKVDTAEVEKILDFMDAESIDYYRCNASVFKKKEKDRYEGYEHAYHILAKEPYGICGSTVIMSKKLHEYREKNGLDNGYAWEGYQLKQAYTATGKWVDGYATDDRNVFHIIHCVEKQKWIVKARRYFLKQGYIIDKDVREVQTISETILANIKELGKRIPIKYRYGIKKIAKKLGFKFVTEY